MFKLEFKLQDNTIIQTNTFIPREGLVRIIVEPDTNDIKNIKLNIHEKEYYLLRELNGFYIDITKDMMNPGKNVFNFSIQRRETSNTNKVEITLTKSNIKQIIHSDIDILNAKLNKIITKMEEK